MLNVGAWITLTLTLPLMVTRVLSTGRGWHNDEPYCAPGQAKAMEARQRRAASREEQVSTAG